MQIKYYIQKRATSGYEWDDGYYDYMLESNKQHAIKLAKEETANSGRSTRVKRWDGRIICTLKGKLY